MRSKSIIYHGNRNIRCLDGKVSRPNIALWRWSKWVWSKNGFEMVGKSSICDYISAWKLVDEAGLARLRGFWGLNLTEVSGQDRYLRIFSYSSKVLIKPVNSASTEISARFENLAGFGVFEYVCVIKICVDVKCIRKNIVLLCQISIENWFTWLIKRSD